MVAGTRSPWSRGAQTTARYGTSWPGVRSSAGSLSAAEPHLDNAGALGPLAGAGTAEDEDDQRLHEAVRAENKRPEGKQREPKAQDLQQPAAAAAQHTPRLCRTLRELTATRPAEARGGAARRGRAEPAPAAAPPR